MRSGLKLMGMKMSQTPESILTERYQNPRRKVFFPVLITYTSSCSVVALVRERKMEKSLQGHNRTHQTTEVAPVTIRVDLNATSVE